MHADRTTLSEWAVVETLCATSCTQRSGPERLRLLPYLFVVRGGYTASLVHLFIACYALLSVQGTSRGHSSAFTEYSIGLIAVLHSILIRLKSDAT